VVRIHHLVADLVQAEPPLFVAYFARTPTGLHPVGDKPQDSKKELQKGSISRDFRPPAEKVLLRADSCCQKTRLELQVAIDEIVLLQASQTFADLAGADRADAVDGLQVAL
jgi:hypothetical protein